MENLQRISKNKESIAIERVEKAKSREATKKKRAIEKELKNTAKEKRAKERDMVRKEIFLNKTKTWHL